MPKVTNTPKTRTQINKDSESKRGIVNKGFKIPKETADLIDQLAISQGVSRGNILVQAIQVYVQSLNQQSPHA